MICKYTTNKILHYLPKVTRMEKKTEFDYNLGDWYNKNILKFNGLFIKKIEICTQIHISPWRHMDIVFYLNSLFLENSILHFTNICVCIIRTTHAKFGSRFQIFDECGNYLGGNYR